MNARRAGRATLSADIGTSSLKAALISVEGEALAFVREPYPAERVLSGRVLASDWETAFRRAVGALLGAAGDRVEIAAVCISGNGPTLVPVAYDGRTLPPLHWHDGRKAPPTGAGGQPSLFLPHAAWLLREDPAAYRSTHYLISTQEWLSHRLGADPVTVLPAAAYGPYYWDDGQCAAYGLDPTKFPPMVVQGDLIGRVSAAGAAEVPGLSAGIPIVAGGPDFIMALVGVGAVENGVVCDRAGTSEGINVCSSRPCRSPELRTLPHIRDGLWNVGAMLPTTGRLFEWFRHITGQQERDYRDMLAEIVRAPARDFKGAPESADTQDGGGGFFFPDIKSSGRLSAASAFLSTAGLTTRAELGRAVVEAIGFMVRGAVDTLERHGYRIEGMRISGGQAKNPLWNQFKADMTGRCLAVPEIPDGELAGDACLAMTALGDASSLEEAISRIVRIREVYEPDRRSYAFHSERYDAYKEQLARMEKFFG